MVEAKRDLDHKDITKLFGPRSQIYGDCIQFLKKKAVSRNDAYDQKFAEWKVVFRDIYGTLEEELFLNHTYFALILKAIVVTKLSVMANLDLDDAYLDYRDSNLAVFHFFEFETFYWVDLSKKLFRTIYNYLEKVQYSREDLFHDMYQHIFMPLTRHKIGEFYTPFNLVKKMVGDFYEFGAKSLDPSCGSGSFLIEMVRQILSSEKPDTLKFDALNNIYGFDINPLAILTAKINIFLLYLGYFDYGVDPIPEINVFLMDSLFPELSENTMRFNLKQLYSSFDLVIGNPPWLTYKDLHTKAYQKKIRDLSEELQIKPTSQYTTHIELAAVFFYSIPYKFLKKGGKIFFVITKSILNGDHCFKFRAFHPFDGLEIWDFPNYYFFNIDHICLKAEYIGFESTKSAQEKYPINTKIFNDELDLQSETVYSSIKIGEKGAKLILPQKDIKVLEKVSMSDYRKKFYQGATLVPRTLVFFEIKDKNADTYTISSDQDVRSRSKRKWRFEFTDKQIEKRFRFKTFLNKDLIPFYLKRKRYVFLPINGEYEFSEPFLGQYPLAAAFYKEMNAIYQDRKKKTSKIETLFDNLNYWNKLTKQKGLSDYLAVYNASGSNLKAAVLHNYKRKIILGSENYYYSTDSKEEAYYLSGILNSPILTRNIKLIKSSRHIHKRPFSFPIPLFNEGDEMHAKLARKAIKCETVVQDLYLNNPHINSDKVRIIINHKLKKIDSLVKQIVFS